MQGHSSFESFTVRAIAHHDLDQLLNWRNRPHVRHSSRNQSLISSKDHIAWFQSLDPLVEQHFIYSWNDTDIGSVSVKALSETDSNCCVTGIYCGEEAFLGHHVNIRALVFLYDYTFVERAFDCAKALVLTSNDRAYRLNEFFGFRHTKSSIGADAIEMEISRSDYIERRERIMEMLG